MIVIINYGVGNLSSIRNILKKIGSEAIISSDKNIIEQAEKLILPGVGNFDYGMQKLHEYGFVNLLNKKVLEEHKPILGICLGAQLFTKKSEEGKSNGLGWLDVETVKFNFSDNTSNFKIPHMGWSEVVFNSHSPLLKDMYPDPRFYFVHSYHFKALNPDNVIAHTKYGYDFVSAIGKDNIVGVQFHPEKSHKYGMQLFKNFIQYY